MCTPSFMCKFPFSRRVLLPRGEQRPTVRRVAPPHPEQVSERRKAYAKSPPPHRRCRRAPAPGDRLHAGRHARGDARRRARQRARDRRRLRRRAAAACARCSPRTAAGARTDFLSFARTWDRFTRAGRDSRPATERELRILVTQLEDSLCERRRLELDEAINEHRALRSRGCSRAACAARPPTRATRRPANARGSPSPPTPPAQSAQAPAPAARRSRPPARPSRARCPRWPLARLSRVPSRA